MAIQGASESAVDRLLGIDLARGLAVFGMYAAHVGPDPGEGGLVGNLMELTHGRSSALFAVLAGFSIVLITGRTAPKSGVADRQAIARVAIRALVLLSLGSILNYLNAQVAVILHYYGIFFLLVLPLYRLSAPQLGLLAWGTALILPQVYFRLESAGSSDDPVSALMVSGTYPAITWVPFVIAGMAIARLGLSTQAMHWRLGLAGGALAVLGYGGSSLAQLLLPVAAALKPSPLAASPHSETTFSILGSTGCAMMVLAACWLAMDALPHLRKLVWPIIAVGSMSLTAYVLHILGIAYLLHIVGIDMGRDGSLSMLFGFIVVISTFAVLWLRVFPRGPMEALMGRTADLARHIP
ncbi:DUF418 domain-containing protein (plasmid) [Sinorhizobium numidicum]|uniref:DUF418 domain-containing protein n=1 Tax=Sinorhizobium numidicum TaxID=680248 RepID=A0ABY8D3E7_9HYPH|nr:DUF418 domain-containing protein [Sinorhizobium numidicum]WEX79642.1 DUF418 domain-containing protein [Sinorhizobium numidicum]WEX85404.1 DUF418 domain-containing protein [Sinorhizobium numidicum]